MRNVKFFLLASGLLAGLTTAAHAAVIDTSTTSTAGSGDTTLTTLDPGAPTMTLGDSTDTPTVDLTHIHHHRHSFRMMMEQMLQAEQSNPGSQSTDVLTSADLDFVNSMPGMSGLARLIHALEIYSKSGGSSMGNGGFILVYLPGSNYVPTPTPPPVIDPGNGGSVPEPTTAALMGGAGLAMVTGRRRRKA